MLVWLVVIFLVYFFLWLYDVLNASGTRTDITLYIIQWCPMFVIARYVWRWESNMLLLMLCGYVFVLVCDSRAHSHMAPQMIATFRFKS